jgi:pimeloyl-ACP methyl ester carboxylesterase
MPFVQTSGLTIHYEVAGTGDIVVVLLHGFGASWRWWLPILKQLPPGYRAYAPDLRGCGDTDHSPNGYTIKQLAVDLHHFAAALNLPPFHLIGHSLGGVVAMQFALDYPALLQTLILVAPAPAEGMSVYYKDKTSLPPPLHLFELRRDLSFDLLDTTYRFLHTFDANRRLLRRALRRMLPTLPDDHFFAALVDDAARMAPQAVVGYMEAVDAWNVQTELAKVHLPAIILWGNKDTLILEAAPLKRTAKALHGRLVIWSNIGHAPQLEQPKRFLRFLTRFVEQHIAVPPPVEPGWFQNWRGRLKETLDYLSRRLHELAHP